MAADKASTTLLDLPVDLLLMIFPYLDAPSFLSFTATCKALHKPDFMHESTFWSALVRHDFRVPNQPVAQTDGERWQKLYKRLRTQSKIFTWGNNEKGCLGHSNEHPGPRILSGPGFRRVPRRTRHVSWPGEMEGLEELGVISDIQCGGWSTTLLTAKGALYTVGVLDGLQFDHRRPPHLQPSHRSPTPLQFPTGLPQPKDRYDPATAIKQFSAGRSHVLALSDSGMIWSWNNIDLPGLRVKFVHHTIKENGSDSGAGVVKKVVAGWNRSVALIEGTGLVLWEPLQLEPDECDTLDAALVLESAVVSKTRHVQKSELPEDADTGEVLNFVVMENTILFNTHLGKLFAVEITSPHRTRDMPEPVEIPIPTSKGAGSDATFVTDVQGSFQNFAVFTKSGAVLTSNQDSIMPRVLNQASTRRVFKRIPALQNKQVISLAFGDYHFHALHAPGYITSYGYEPQSCGALGLGGMGVPEGRLRGMRNQGIGGDGRLVPHAYTEGRRVWFEQEKREWVSFITSGGVDEEEAAERVRMAIGSPGITAQGEVSEWIEQEGRDWAQKYGVNSESDDDDGLGAYFALNVTAAGWHSGALVLVNESMAESCHYIWSNDHFPRLKLSDGTEMPGTVPFDEWRYGRPDFQLDWEEQMDEQDE
ncbi:uncharacterized protein MYCFIDRAFT_41302 [Pseudocercospora fijiensis CIRAD86]|uniref:F-box domain-containing protein n=1 Tax=Pseudocercospora fijiensis (strain CIRAD86) TaxID=383855 RepID=M2Z7N6_PSEFD|nr:uncharacterized protein MYCFIDRAFT_41302 [Pseudocercospora fijiensis CIRAD86]EME85755.1 hypothetical protein MYCFIDRAFT_41302 [Pseudocercospora fijiensis CIRAD86]